MQSKYRRFSFDEIKLATDEFSSQNYVGEDGYGKIYRGNIYENDHDYLVSVKRFDNESEIALKVINFQTEMWFSIHHSNIISLFGFCDEEDEKILLYEFMATVSLHSCLFNDTDQTCNLTVNQRLEICIGIANGLSYLGTQFNIIHGQVNTHNILLDGNFVPKLLAPQFTNCVQGHHEAPECSGVFDTTMPSPKVDVYALSVVLLELLCERPAWKTLIRSAWRSIVKGELPEFTPEHVWANISEECSRVCTDLVKVCLQNDPDRRPSMNQMKDELVLALQQQKQQKIVKRILQQGSECRLVRLKDIREATNEFANDNLIGEGTFWKSYRGFAGNTFKGDFFVKRINRELAVKTYDFKHEVEVLADCNRHVNIISTLGYCYEKNENIMVHRLMSNGLLYDYLYNDQDNAPRLTELQRLDICLGVAHGLSYLHMKEILHGNLSTYNIFLDHNLVPSISGMDLAFRIHHKHGTEGYPAPECYEPGYKPTKQADVYAFGILLLEVLCEKPSWKSLVMLALEFAMKRELPRKSRNEHVEVSLSGECLRACENLIEDCLDVDPDKRPFMRQVVGELELALKLQTDLQNGKVNSQKSSSQLNNPSSSSPCERFLFSDIAKATNDFSICLGEGAFGKVYRGNISGDSYNGVVAVKRITMKPEQGIPSFNKEKQLVSACDHVNIITLVGFCDEESEKILLYEFMPNGSLYDYLHKDKVRAARLTIEQRLEICIGVAKGLVYLHTRTDYVIIHSDLKTDNILLDQNLVPKISDFGLSRSREAGPSTSKQITYSTKGTEGYLAPECYEPNYQLSRKADVYSFGVVLLEVLCERPPWERLVISALPSIRSGQFPNFTPDYVGRQISERCSRACQHLILECLDTDPVKRPDMNQVVTKLHEALRMEKEYSKDRLHPFIDPQVFSSSSDRVVIYHECIILHYYYYSTKSVHDEIPEGTYILEKYKKRVDDRNVLFDPSYKEQLKKIFGRKKYTLPQLFIGGKHIGGIDKIRKLKREGTLEGMLAGIPDRDYPSPCETCDDMRFVKCVCFNTSDEGKKCPNGDCKECNDPVWIGCRFCKSIYLEECVLCIKARRKVKTCRNGDCKECNEMRLIRCPDCCSWQSDLYINLNLN